MSGAAPVFASSSRKIPRRSIRGGSYGLRKLFWSGHAFECSSSPLLRTGRLLDILGDLLEPAKGVQPTFEVSNIPYPHPLSPVVIAPGPCTDRC